jgi:hypothetical protein
MPATISEAPIPLIPKPWHSPLISYLMRDSSRMSDALATQFMTVGPQCLFAVPQPTQSTLRRHWRLGPVVAPASSESADDDSSSTIVLVRQGRLISPSAGAPSFSPTRLLAIDTRFFEPL